MIDSYEPERATYLYCAERCNGYLHNIIGIIRQFRCTIFALFAYMESAPSITITMPTIIFALALFAPESPGNAVVVVYPKDPGTVVTIDDEEIETEERYILGPGTYEFKAMAEERETVTKKIDLYADTTYYFRSRLTSIRERDRINSIRGALRATTYGCAIVEGISAVAGSVLISMALADQSRRDGLTIGAYSAFGVAALSGTCAIIAMVSMPSATTEFYRLR